MAYARRLVEKTRRWRPHPLPGKAVEDRQYFMPMTSTEKSTDGTASRTSLRVDTELEGTEVVESILPLVAGARAGKSSGGGRGAASAIADRAESSAGGASHGADDAAPEPRRAGGKPSSATKAKPEINLKRKLAEKILTVKRTRADMLAHPNATEHDRSIGGALAQVAERLTQEDVTMEAAIIQHNVPEELLDGATRALGHADRELKYARQRLRALGPVAAA